MYPMITSIEEIKQIKVINEEVRKELDDAGVPYKKDIEQGIMVETPAAAIMTDQLAPEVDFFSIGTNDLTQYTLAMDRQNDKLDTFYQAHHPAILRLIQMTIENGHKGGAWVGICGELGADTTLTQTFLQMGVDELSVSPSMILPVREAIRNSHANV
jgi:phosphotransferase system enzyme I (PtsI)